MYLKSAFVISFVAYVLLILLEVIQHGFVSNYFSAHWLLLVSAILFAIMVCKKQDIFSRGALEWIFALTCALIFAVVTWSLGRQLEELRVLLTFVGFVLPFCVLLSLKES